MDQTLIAVAVGMLYKAEEEANPSTMNQDAEDGGLCDVSMTL